MISERDRVTAEYARREDGDGDRYEPSAPGPMLIRHELERVTAQVLAAAGALPLGERRILEVGCGYGGWLQTFAAWGAPAAGLAGIDILEHRAAAAAERLPGADVHAGDAAQLPWADASFDVVAQSMMLSSVLDPATRSRAAAEMVRVLRPGGVLLSYDFFVAKPGNTGVRALTRRELRTAFRPLEVHARRLTLAPPLARALADRAWPVASALTRLRVLDTHLLATATKPGA